MKVAGGNMLRLTLKLASAPDGTSKGTLVSVDQAKAIAMAWLPWPVGNWRCASDITP